MKIRTMAVLATVASVAAAANANNIIVDGLGGPAVMQSKDMGATVFGGSSAPNFTQAALQSIHDDINGDGISTDGLITFVLLDVDTDGDSIADSLAFITLIDDENGGAGADDSTIGMISSANAQNVEWINDSGENIVVGDSGQLSSAIGTFEWNSNGEGDGFAWADLDGGDFVTFNFDRTANGDEIESFQFLTWGGASWNVLAEREWTAQDQFAFSFTVIPLPAAAWLGLAGLGGAAIARRRRMA